MERKLDISAISFDDMLGDGLESTEVVDNEVVEDVNEVEEVDEEEVDPVLNEVEDTEEEYENEEEEEEENVEEEMSDEEASDIISDIAGTLGFELNGEYEETVEGLTDFVRDLSQQVAENQLEGLFEQYPEVQKHLDFLMAGGKSEEFMKAYNPQVDFAAVEIDQEDISSQRIILANYFQAKGHDNEFIDEMLDTLESSGKLYSKSLVAKDELANAQEQQRQYILQQQQEEFQRQMEETNKFWEEIADTIESGNEFAGVRIPDKEKARFFDYISEPVGPNGETQRDLDYGEADINVKLAIDYLMYNGFKLDDIIEKKARTKSAQSLRERIISNEDRVKSARKARRSKQFDVDDLDMNALLG
jgi:hypothetical protein